MHRRFLNRADEILAANGDAFRPGHAPGQMLSWLDHRAVIPAFPEGSRTLFPAVVPLRELAFDLLHPLADQAGFFASHQEVGVVGSQTIAKNLHRKMVQTLPHDLAVAVAVFGKFEQKLTIMTAMGQVIEFSRQEVAVGSGHAGSIVAIANLLQRKKALKKSL